MSLRLGDIAPDFIQELTEGTIRFHDWIDSKWVMLKAEFLEGWKELRPYLWTQQLNKNNG